MNDIKNEPKGFHAEQRLMQIVHEIYNGSKEYSKALILFATPELTIQANVLNQLVQINRARKLMRFIIDEFDVAAERTKDY
eukprot:2441014-Ditylum_brightwellii.AAC.1